MDTHKAYRSLHEYLDDAAQGRYSLEGGSSFYGSRSLSDAISYLKVGEANTPAYREALAIMEKVDTSFRDREQDQWMPDVIGAYPVVPEYLMGLPENMRRRNRIESDLAPVKLLMEIIVSAGVSESELMRRGAAIAALATRMSEERPTELYAMASLRDGRKRSTHSFIVRIDSTPVNLAQACAVFATRESARRVVFNWMNQQSHGVSNSGINWGLGYPTPQREEKFRKLFSLEPQDIVIQGGFLPDAYLMESDPVEWVHRQLDKQRTLED